MIGFSEVFENDGRVEGEPRPEDAEITQLKEQNADYETMFGFIGLELRPEGGLKYGEIKAEIAELKKRIVRALTICQPACLSRIPSEDEARKYVRGQEARVAELEEQLAAATEPTRVPKSVHDRVVAQLKAEVSANTKLAVHWMGKAEALQAIEEDRDVLGSLFYLEGLHEENDLGEVTDVKTLVEQFLVHVRKHPSKRRRRRILRAIRRMQKQREA